MKENNDPFTFKQGGEMGIRIREKDWSQTLLGPAINWPPSLKTAINIMITAKFPMMVHWGKQLIHFYNDGYAVILQNKHPGALGEPAYPWWSEIWNLLEPIFQQVWAGETTFFQDQLVTPNRRGFIEEAYFTYSHSPIYDEQGQVGGILATAMETTNAVVNRRRLAMLSHLASNTIHEKEVKSACHAIANSMATNPEDIPFALIYLINSSGTELQLTGTVGDAVNNQASPHSIYLETNHQEQSWPANTVIATGTGKLVNGLEEKFGPLIGKAWPEPSRQAIILPIKRAGQVAGELPYGVIIGGISPRRTWDVEYESFYNLVAEQAGRIIANAQAATEERIKLEELAQLNLAKTNFFSNISHEFRTPLTLILGPLESFIKQNKLTAAEFEALNLINRNAQRLLHLVNNLLNFAQAEAGRMQASFRATDLPSLTRQLSAAFQPAVEAAGLTFVVDCAPISEPVYVDEKLYESILFNLLSNALKFTFTGTITVSLQSVGKQVILQVSDTGTGIAEEDLPHLFTRFHRIRGAHGRTYEGSGLGLALVEELVKAHNGNVSVESIYGQGTCFTVTLPLGQQHLTQEQVITLQEGRVQLQADVDTAYLHWSTPTMFAAEQADETLISLNSENKQGRKPLILIVDDNGDMRQYLQHILSEDYQLIQASDGLAAWDLIVALKPSLVLSDVMMPQLNGYELVKKIRSDFQFRNLPVILLSALSGSEVQAAGLETGADDYINKPFSSRELKARVMANLKLAQLRSQLEVILDDLGAGFGVINSEGCFTYVNQKLEQILFKKKEKILGYPVSQVLSLESQVKLKQHISQLAAIHSTEQFEYYHELSDQWFQISLTPYNEGISVLFIDITDRKNAAKELQSSLKESNVRNLALLRLNSTLDNFVHIVAHDLKSPANNLKALLKIQQEEEDPEKKEEIMLMFDSEITRLQTTLNGLMILIRTQNSDELGATPINFKDVFQVITQELGTTIKEQKAEIKADFEQGEIIVYPEAYLMSILKNLISNAIKYRSPDRPPKIEVSTKQQANGVLLTVQDNGIGLDLTKHRAQLFEPFKRLNTTTEGTGLGLYLVQSIVEKNNGFINVDSQLGKGTTFAIYLQNYSTKEL